MTRNTRSSGPATRHGLARVLSKAGLCSRTEAAQWIAAGRVAVDGRLVRDTEFPVVQGRHRVAVDGRPLGDAARHYLLLNKPRGLVTTARDERGRDTVYRCFDGAGLPWLAPVGRLDKASEGLLLFSNDPGWAARITDPDHGPGKTYHVQIDCVPGPEALAAMVAGVPVQVPAAASTPAPAADARAGGRVETLRARSATLLRAGERNAWLEIVLDEGRNRQIRRLLAALDIGVLRLVRVAIGPLRLGDLPKGQWRALEAAEVAALAPASVGPA